jgi:hypothetical protein
MGVLFCKEDNKYQDKVTCYKCGDKFYTDKTGLFSQRKSCRFHDFDKNGVCINCHEKNLYCNHTCFHVKKKHWLYFLTG